METLKKILFELIFCYAFFGVLSSVHNTGWPFEFLRDLVGWPFAVLLCFLTYKFIMLVIKLAFLLYKVLKNASKDSNADGTKDGRTIGSWSYRLELSIVPHWNEIISKSIPGLENDDFYLVMKFAQFKTTEHSENVMDLQNHDLIIFKHSDSRSQIWYETTKTFLKEFQFSIKMFPDLNEKETEAAIEEFSNQDENFKKLVRNSKIRKKKNIFILQC